MSITTLTTNRSVNNLFLTIINVVLICFTFIKIVVHISIRCCSTGTLLITTCFSKLFSFNACSNAVSVNTLKQILVTLLLGCSRVVFRWIMFLFLYFSNLLHMSIPFRRGVLDLIRIIVSIHNLLQISISNRSFRGCSTRTFLFYFVFSVTSSFGGTFIGAIHIIIVIHLFLAQIVEGLVAA